MGLIATLIEWARGSEGDTEFAEARVDPGGDDLLTATHYQPAGLDSYPRPGDLVLLVPGSETGTWEVAGYLDPLNAGTAREGEVSLYLRDANGAVQGELFLASDTPSWKSGGGAKIARGDRADDLFAEVKSALDAGAEAAVPHGAGAAGDNGKAAFEAASAALAVALGLKSTNSDKGWVT